MADSWSKSTKPNADKNTVNTPDSLPRDHYNILVTGAGENGVSVVRVVREGVAYFLESRWPLLSV